jgi:hypothetical protein
MSIDFQNFYSKLITSSETIFIYGLTATHAGNIAFVAAQALACSSVSQMTAFATLACAAITCISGCICMVCHTITIITVLAVGISITITGQW